MQYCVLEYEVVDDYVNRRAPFRQLHLGLIREAHARGDLRMAGAVGDPPEGALLLFRSDSSAVAEDFAGTGRRMRARPMKHEDFVPVPLEPMTGKPFEYQRDGQTAVLISTVSGEPVDSTGLRLRIVLRK